jgi:hypothetical protein
MRQDRRVDPLTHAILNVVERAGNPLAALADIGRHAGLGPGSATGSLKA